MTHMFLILNILLSLRRESSLKPHVSLTWFSQPWSAQKDRSPVALKPTTISFILPVNLQVIQPTSLSQGVHTPRHSQPLSPHWHTSQMQSPWRTSGGGRTWGLHQDRPQWGVSGLWQPRRPSESFCASWFLWLVQRHWRVESASKQKDIWNGIQTTTTRWYGECFSCPGGTEHAR